MDSANSEAELPPLSEEAPARPRVRPVREMRLGIARSLVLCAVWLVICVVVSIPLEIARHFGRVQMDMFSVLLIQQAIAWPVTLWLGLVWGKVPLGEAFPLKWFSWKIVVPIIVASIGFEIVLTGVASLIPMPTWIKDFIHQSVAQSSSLGILVPVVLVAPVAEELFFRGLVLRGYLGRYSVSKSIWASAILFALFHMNPWQGIVALPLGVFVAWLVVRTGSLLPGMLAHFTVNLSGTWLMMQIALALGYEEATLREIDNIPVSLFAIGMTLSLAGSVELWRQLKRPPFAAVALAGPAGSPMSQEETTPASVGDSTNSYP